MTTVLVVDDEYDLMSGIQGLLEDEGYDVVTCPNGRAALDYLAGPERPDVALIDVMMPILNGLELLKLISGDARLDGLPVVVMSAVEQRQNELHALAGKRPLTFLKKPFTAERLLKVVRQIGAQR